MLEKAENSSIWKKRLDNTKWILTLLIVFYHIPVPENVNDLQEKALLYCKNLGECVVTSFALISGFLFFYNAHNLFDIYIKMRKRIWTLFVPYILWNFINSLYLILRNNGISAFFKEIFIADWIKNIFYWGSSPHFWYIFMLIFWTVLAPALFIIYRSKGLLATLLLLQTVYFIYKGADILTSRYVYILYTWGGALGKYFPNLFENISCSNEKKRKLYFSFFLIIFLIIRLFYNEVTNNGILVWCYGARSIFLILALINAPYEWIGIKTNYDFSFWVFAIHYYLDMIISGYVYNNISIVAVQILSWIFVLTFIIILGILVKYLSPKFFSMLTGHRNNRTY